VQARRVVAVVATLSKGFDLEYISKQVNRGLAKDAASYYIQVSETGGEPPGRWWGPVPERSDLGTARRSSANPTTSSSGSAKPPMAPR
jgi:hypothetical protein